ncbi:MAG: family 10 glycosylhydrolase [Kiritimatiellaceae bacterium]|nr:family 10 glycosylhydrolase [Kiritimatiellaceae bacterium]
MKRFVIQMAILLAVTTMVIVLFVKISGRSVLPPVRAIWVTRFDYSTPEDVRSIINNVGKSGFTDVFFQIRGNGTAYYKSSLEPWAYELSGGKLPMLGRDPGWDPLQLAIDTSGAYGLRVHAYMNVLPGWKGLKDPPAQAGQLWTEHPDWFMVDSLGQKMLPTSGWYSFVNPVLPEVQSHLCGIVKELCSYDIAGVHLDYIRYPHDYHLVASQHYPKATKDELMRHADFSYDKASQAALYEKYGWDISKDKITKFRCDSITKVVREIACVMQVEKPNGCLLSASVMGNPTEGKHYAFQDSGAWVRAGEVDWVVQMNYGTRSFNRYLSAMKKATGRRRFPKSVVVGLNCKNEVGALLNQIDSVEKSCARGLAFFSYEYLFGKDHQETNKGRIVLNRIIPRKPRLEHVTD